MRGKNPPRSLAQKPLSPPCRRIQYLLTGYFADPAICVRATVTFVAELWDFLSHVTQLCSAILLAHVLLFPRAFDKGNSADLDLQFSINH